MLNNKMKWAVENALQANTAVVSANETYMREHSDEFLAVESKPAVGSLEDGHLRPLIDWALTFCDFVGQSQQIAKDDEKLRSIDDEIRKNIQMKERVAKMIWLLEHNNINKAYSDICDIDINRFHPLIFELTQTDKQQLEAYKLAYNRFEKNYFAELSAAYKNN